MKVVSSVLDTEWRLQRRAGLGNTSVWLATEAEVAGGEDEGRGGGEGPGAAPGPCTNPSGAAGGRRKVVPWAAEAQQCGYCDGLQWSHPSSA